MSRDKRRRTVERVVEKIRNLDGVREAYQDEWTGERVVIAVKHTGRRRGDGFILERHPDDVSSDLQSVCEDMGVECVSIAAPESDDGTFGSITTKLVFAFV